MYHNIYYNILFNRENCTKCSIEFTYHNDILRKYY